MLAGMTYIERSSPEQIDHVRLTTFQRSESRPDGKLRRSPAETQKAHRKASGRLRQAVYRCSLDTKRKPESSVIGMALLAAVATTARSEGFDDMSAGIISAAFADLTSRGYDRSEIEAVFRRFRKMLSGARPDIASNE